MSLSSFVFNTLCVLSRFALSQLYPPNDKDTPLKIAVAVKNIIKQLESEGHDNNFTMHLDGLLKFGDYHPFRMRMVQLEAYGNWTNAESKVILSTMVWV